MDPRIKDALGAVAILGVLGALYAAIVGANAFANSIEPGSYRSFSVSGEGKVVAVPDVAQFSFTILSEGGKDLAKVQKDNTEKANKAVAYVKSKGVDSKDIKTSQYSINPRYQYYNCNPSPYSSGEPTACPPPEIVGYTVRQSVTVKVRALDKVGDILSGVVDNGANEVSGPSFVIDDPTSVQDEARTEAIVKAQAKAKAVAEAGGFSLGRLLGIDESSGYPQVYYDKMAYGRGGGAEGLAVSAPAPVVEPGSQDVTVSVTLRYEIR